MNGAAFLTGLDAPDLEGRLAPAFEGADHSLRFFWSDNDRHPDAAVEGARHFLRPNPPARLEERENLRQGPSISIYDCVAAFWHNPWNIL